MKKYIAEAFGTGVLVLVGCGAAVIGGDQIGALGVALAFGLTLMAMVYTIGPVSGCHINPAVTAAMWMRGKLSTNEAVLYVIAQLIGAIVGACLLALILGTTANLGVNGFGVGYAKEFTLGSAFVLEAVITMIFIMVIIAATSRKDAASHAGLIIGLTLTMLILVAHQATGASLNPARSFGPALLSGGEALSQLWLFIVAPLIGSVLAAMLSGYISDVD